MDSCGEIRMNITPENLPSNFENILVENSNVVSIRCNLKSMDDINQWVKDFGNNTNTHWNSRQSLPSGKKFICTKKFICHHSAYKKVPSALNKKGLSKNVECLASISAKIKLNTIRNRLEDEFIERGLVGIITITPFHTHYLFTPEILRFLPADDCKEQFVDYFNDGMRVAEAVKYHKKIMEMKSDFKASDLANSRLNPTPKTVEYWFSKWKLHHLGSQTGQGMIEESVPTAVDHSPENNTGTQKSVQKKKLIQKVIQLIRDGFEKFNCSEQVLEKAVVCLEKISSDEQWEMMWANLGSNVPFSIKARAAIRIQPKSVARRPVGVLRGSKRLAFGHPRKGFYVPKKGYTNCRKIEKGSN